MKDEFLVERELILKHYSETFEVDLHNRGVLSRHYRALIRSAFRSPDELLAFSKIWSVVLKVMVYVVGFLITLFFKLNMPEIATTVAATSGIFYSVGLWLETRLPKDLAEYKNAAQVLEMQDAVQRLAAQIALHSSLAKLSNDDDAESIEKLSKKIEAQVKAALEGEWETKKDFPNSAIRNNDHWNTAVRVEAIDPEVLRKFSSIAALIAEACDDIFGTGNYTVKVYIRTRHSINHLSNSGEFELLTSLGRHPQRKVPSNPTGRSWVDCNGKRADVWDCLHNGRTSVVYGQPKGPGAAATYASLAQIPLPDGIGVITIESKEKDMFGKCIAPDVERSLRVATRAMIRELI